MNAYRLAHLFFLGRAIARGPVYLAAYFIRRIARQQVWHVTKGLK